MADAVCILIADKTATRQNIGFRQGLQPISRHAVVTIIAGPTFMRKRLCNFVDDFPSGVPNWYAKIQLNSDVPVELAIISEWYPKSCVEVFFKDTPYNFTLYNVCVNTISNDIGQDNLEKDHACNH